MRRKDKAFPGQFISASAVCADFDRQVPAPYMRKAFSLDALPERAELLITGLGFYRVFLNGTELTKCILAPYISNPDDIIYYDRYDCLPHLAQGENVLGVILGNGMQNAYGGFVWDFDLAPWRGAPMTALWLDMAMPGGERVLIQSDASFRTHPSPLLEDDLRAGDVYDARLRIDGWCMPGFRDGAWAQAIEVLPPRGEGRLCGATPIKAYEHREAVSITPYEDGYLYDFGVNAAGVCTLRIQGTPGQRVDISYGEWLHDGTFEKKNLMFPEYGFPHTEAVQNSTYICRGDGEESYTPYFTFYGFQYALVRGITQAQATRALLTYHLMGGDFREVGGFSCSDGTANALQEMTRRSVLSNFLWIPTDCPHREKNGWTGDVAMSAEHMLMNLAVDDSLREWLRNVIAAQVPSGELPGIVPTGGWGLGYGPAWDMVIVEVPYRLYRLRGDLDTAREAAPSILRYLFYLSGIRNARGLVDRGLGDWCEAGKSGGGQKAPVEVTSTAVSVDLLEKAKLLLRQLGMEAERDYADRLQRELRAAFRRYLIDFPTMTVKGSCQASQAMAIYYGLFDAAEAGQAFARLMEIIHQDGDHISAGALGLRVLFHVLAEFGEADLAYSMIVRPDYPSYGHWLARGATSLWEDFLPPDGDVHSQNHHFFGDISSWFMQRIAGIVPNPYAEDADAILVAPRFIEALSHAGAHYCPPSGRIDVSWRREDGGVRLEVALSGALRGEIRLPPGWAFADGFRQKPLEPGEYLCRQAP